MLRCPHTVLGAEGGITLIPGSGRSTGPSGRTTAPWWSREVVQASWDSPRPNESLSVRNQGDLWGQKASPL